MHGADTVVAFNTAGRPSLTQILIHFSYAAIGKQLGTKSPVTYWIGNPNSYVWLDSNRPLSTTSCPEYDFYRDGYTNFTEYPSKC